MSEENFWRNYFYRVTLICQANDLSYMSRDGDSQLATDTTLSDHPIGKISRNLLYTPVEFYVAIGIYEF